MITTITDPAAAPAAELAQLYTQRWEIETAFDVLNTHQRGPALVQRSKMPDGVIQEVYGYLCVHYAIRWLMHSTATDYGHDPDRLSFIRSLRAARRTKASHPGFSPDVIGDAEICVTTEILHELVPRRRPRANPRVVKRKMSGYQLKHTHHRNAPTIDRRVIVNP